LVWLDTSTWAATALAGETVLVYGISLAAAFYLVRTLVRVFRPRRGAAPVPGNKRGGCQGCDRCG
jgi:hypothetical protein